MQHSILYFPDYLPANPYQSLLYSGLDAGFHAQSGSLEDARLRLRGQASDSRVIFHLHWQDAIYRHLPSEGEALGACQRFLDQLEGFQDDGGLVLWTVHQLAPAEGPHRGVHRELGAKLASLADQIHLHSHGALEELERECPLERDKVTVIPQGNYRSLFPNPCSFEPRPADDGRRILLFGRLDRAKGGSELVQSVAELEDAHARLTIAGLQTDPIELSGVPAAVRARIDVRDRHLSDAELPALFGDADFVVWPRRPSLSPGAVLLALSLGRPVIVPRLPTLAELVIDGDNGLLFAPDDPASLGLALERACRTDAKAWERMARRAFATAGRYDWRLIGHLLSGLLYRLTAKPWPRRLPTARPAEG
jgi:beta-1,4-mannosyltransferase